MPNQNPEQISRDQIDAAFIKSGWIFQGMKQLNFHTGIGVAFKEFQTDVSPADYLMFVDSKHCGKNGVRNYLRKNGPRPYFILFTVKA